MLISKFINKIFRSSNKNQKTILNIALLLLIILQSISNQCDEFCLKCSSSDNCEICDFTANKTLNGQKCENNPISNCLISLNMGVCDKCSSDYKFDPTNKECVKGDFANCLFYDSSGKCSTCAQGSYLENNECVSDSKIIQNCLRFQENVVSDGGTEKSKLSILIF